MTQDNILNYLKYVTLKEPNLKAVDIFSKMMDYIDYNGFFNIIERRNIINDLQDRLFPRAIIERCDEIGNLPEEIPYREKLDLIFFTYPPRKGYSDNDIC